MRGESAAVHHDSCALGQCLLAALGEPSVRAPLADSLYAQWVEPRGDYGVSVGWRLAGARNADARARRALTRNMPGTGPPSIAVGESGSAALSLPARWPAIQARRKAARLDNSRSALAYGIESAACFRSCAHGRPVFRRAVRPASRRRRQSLLEGQPRPASVRCAHHRGTRLTQWRLTPSLEDASTPLRDPLRRLRGRFIPFRHIPSRRQARHSSASTAPRRTRFAHKHSSRRVLPMHTPYSAAPAPVAMASADCEQSLRLRCSDGKCDSHLRVCAFAD